MSFPLVLAALGSSLLMSNPVLSRGKTWHCLSVQHWEFQSSLCYQRFACPAFVCGRKRNIEWFDVSLILFAMQRDLKYSEAMELIRESYGLAYGEASDEEKLENWSLKDSAAARQVSPGTANY